MLSLPVPKIAVLLIALPLFAGSIPSTITLSTSNNPSVFGRAVTLTASVTPTTATGTVTFYNGTAVLETEPVASGKAVFTTTLLPAGAGSLTARFSGDSTYATSSSKAYAQTVNTVESSGFPSAVPYPVDEGADFVAVGDFNGDGNADLAVADIEFGVSVLLGNGDGTFQTAVDYSPDVNPFSIGVGDFNGDGKLDLALADATSNGVAILLGNGDGTFQAAVEYAVGLLNFPYSLAVADFNQDGIADLAVANVNGGTVSILLGLGNATFPSVTTYQAGTQPSSLAIGDFNGDGYPDVVIANWRNPLANVGVLLGKGDGTLQPVVNYPAGSGSYSVAVADFNGDGKPDIAVANWGSKPGLSVLLGNGDGIFQPALFTPDTLGPFAIQAGDFNGDGKLDIAAANQTVNSVSTLVGNGDGTFQQPNTYATGQAPYSVAVANFIGDGRADLAVANYFDNVSVLLATSAIESFTALTANPNPSSYGEKVTLTATVSPLSATGTMSFYNGSAGLAKVRLNGGIATLIIPSLHAGTDSLTASYSGDANLPKSISPVVEQVVTRASTDTGLSGYPNPSSVGNTVKFTAHVSPATATGTVTFYEASTVLGTGSISRGIAVLDVSTLSAGSHSITAAYGGDLNHRASASPTVTEIVN